MATSVALDAEAYQKNNYVGGEASGSTIGAEQIQDGSVEKASSALFEHTAKTSPNSSQSDLSEESVDLNPDPKSIELVVGCQDDPLIPSPDQIDHTFLKGQNTWRAYITPWDGSHWVNVKDGFSRYEEGMRVRAKKVLDASFAGGKFLWLGKDYQGFSEVENS
ncbi:uncharacterized protein BP5553_10318 [Venustampulla echinocandica]|uniref:Uncharacterized protein n=1 Tax=Venustampulla echinocandica TaxID=2656787 RepID=A0A370T9V2_9HELO|nr:uncharacterized protein BP5553_10318 [Venustampulla echinocandica]RDL30440.1 hypothetical protein BP5553_10318 [Venustampulla echinocandica]